MVPASCCTLSAHSLSGVLGDIPKQASSAPGLFPQTCSHGPWPTWALARTHALTLTTSLGWSLPRKGGNRVTGGPIGVVLRTLEAAGLLKHPPSQPPSQPRTSSLYVAPGDDPVQDHPEEAGPVTLHRSPRSRSGGGPQPEQNLGASGTRPRPSHTSPPLPQTPRGPAQEQVWSRWPTTASG